ncbi:hypothetical protein F441_03700, partial [Phytophthora nicotianae CJ01A1]
MELYFQGDAVAASPEQMRRQKKSRLQAYAFAKFLRGSTTSYLYSRKKFHEWI